MSPTTKSPLEPHQGLLVVSCSRKKLVTTAPIPALELYQGALVPHLREHLAPAKRARIRILSAEHGLLHAGDPIDTYDRKLRNRSEAEALQNRVTARLTADLRTPALRHVLVVLEPLYLTAAACLFNHAPPIELTLLPNPADWAGAKAVLSQWGWL
ncbi:DUF6884 domain-containing protein [Streptoalloteichus hindustanus]|uniref:DUF6884 domain-containing protein n=1 Tax=Streptoalloteichus hindustanus TaxID=2017 RepID=A0A1M5D107_STRHI|nr:DUF6884 domain-containing protein [Streptoalloteichus hindustanus]SHF60560.1 hypothetical protein SAMN05444320_104250 [Streptoalloteichus hindustanus]